MTAAIEAVTLEICSEEKPPASNPAGFPIVQAEDFPMAKALLGHVATPSSLLLEETVILRSRIRALEAELADLREERDVLLYDGLRRLADEASAPAAPVPA